MLSDHDVFDFLRHSYGQRAAVKAMNTYYDFVYGHTGVTPQTCEQQPPPVAPHIVGVKRERCEMLDTQGAEPPSPLGPNASTISVVPMAVPLGQRLDDVPSGEDAVETSVGEAAWGADMDAVAQLDMASLDALMEEPFTDWWLSLMDDESPSTEADVGNPTVPARPVGQGECAAAPAMTTAAPATREVIEGEACPVAVPVMPMPVRHACKQCGRVYATTDGVRKHWRKAHSGLSIGKGNCRLFSDPVYAGPT